MIFLRFEKATAQRSVRGSVGLRQDPVAQGCLCTWRRAASRRWEALHGLFTDGFDSPQKHEPLRRVGGCTRRAVQSLLRLPNPAREEAAPGARAALGIAVFILSHCVVSEELIPEGSSTFLQ